MAPDGSLPSTLSHCWSREMQKHLLSLTNPGGAGLFNPEAGPPLPQSNSWACLSSSLISWKKLDASSLLQLWEEGGGRREGPSPERRASEQVSCG